MKRILGLAGLAVMAFSASLPVASAEECGDDACTLRNKTLAAQNAEGFWPSVIDPGVLYDAMTLGVGQKIGLLDSETKEKFVKKILAHQKPGGWPTLSGSMDVDLNATGRILYCLKQVGVPEDDPRVADTWKQFKQAGGFEKMGVNAKAFLYAIGAPVEFPEKLIPPPFVVDRKTSLGKAVDLDQIGVVRAIFPSFSLIRYLRNSGDPKNPEVSRMIEMMAETRTLDQGWYVSYNTLTNLLALAEAKKAGVKNLDPMIKDAWQSLVHLEGTNIDGEPIFQPNRSTVWDTASFSLALLLDSPEKNKPALDRAISWFKRIQLSPENGYTEAKGQGGWSFDHLDQTFPDSDDTGLIVYLMMAYAKKFPEHAEELKKPIQMGIDFILRIRNRDGGFPAFEKSTGKFAKKIMRTVTGEHELFDDESQVDVTARVLETLSEAHASHSAEIPDYERIRQQACNFIYSRAEGEYRPSDKSASPLKLWRGTWFDGTLYGTSSALSGLLHGDCIVARKTEFFENYVNMFAELQHPDGGFGEAKESSQVERSLVVLKFLTDYLHYQKSHPGEGKKSGKALSVARKAIDYVKTQLARPDLKAKNLGYHAVYFPGEINVNYENVKDYAGLGLFARWKEIVGHDDALDSILRQKQDVNLMLNSVLPTAQPCRSL